MRNTIYLLLCLFLSGILLSSCDKEAQEAKKFKDKITGVWRQDGVWFIENGGNWQEDMDDCSRHLLMEFSGDDIRMFNDSDPTCDDFMYSGTWRLEQDDDKKTIIVNFRDFTSALEWEVEQLGEHTLVFRYDPGLQTPTTYKKTFLKE